MNVSKLFLHFFTSSMMLTMLLELVINYKFLLRTTISW